MKRRLCGFICFTGILMYALCGCSRSTAGVGKEDTLSEDTKINHSLSDTDNAMDSGIATAGNDADTANSTDNTDNTSTEITNGRTVTQSGPYGTISITLPDGWNYELCPTDDDKLISGKYGIHIYPDTAEDNSRETAVPENNVLNLSQSMMMPKDVASFIDSFTEISYSDLFGLCGTGLSEENITLAGDSAIVCTYDNKDYWDFVIFNGKNSGVTVTNYNVDLWWDDYGNQLMNILDTIEFDTTLKEGGAYVYNEESEVPDIGLYFTLKKITATGAVMVFNQYDADNLSGELIYGDAFTLEMADNDGNWVDVPIAADGSYAFHEEGYILEENTQTMTDVDWEWLYGELEPGEYRLTKTITNMRGAGDNKTYIVRAYFILN